MKKYLISAVFALLPMMGFAAGSAVSLDSIEVDASDKTSLQLGAQTYMDYCMGCHSLKYARYNRVARDLGIPEDKFRATLMHSDAAFGSLMDNAMPGKQSKAWFGTTPPDLTLVTRLRGTDWLYSYMRGFYVDASRPWGVNNLVFKDVGMPHVLAELQGVCAEAPQMGPHEDRGTHDDGCKKLAVEGTQTKAEYDTTVYDLVNFLAYMGDPNKLERERLGWMVLLFLAVFWFISLLYTREMKKDIH